MGDDRQEIVGKWNCQFKQWRWEYVFTSDGKVTWRDPLNGMNGAGRWVKTGALINITWYDSATKESWKCPIQATDQKAWYDASYGVGWLTANKASDAPRMPAGVQVDPSIGNLPWDRYVDQFVECKYDMNYKIPPDKSFAYSSILQLTYGDGVALELDFESEISSQQLSSAEAFDALAKGFRGRGERIFPRIMAPATVPRLWEAREDALAAQNEDFKAFANVAMTGVSFILSVPAMPAGAPPPAGIKVGRQRVPGVPRRGPAPAGATEITMSKEQYLRALSHVFPSDALNPVASEIDGIAVRAAQNASKDPRFLSAWAADDMKLAGTLFHSQAAQEVRRVPPGSLPSGWRISAERTLQAGRGGGRADVFLEGPAGQLVEVDWKTTGSSAVSSKAVSQMQKHSGQVRTMTGGSSLTQQESRSWIDYIRALVPP